MIPAAAAEEKGKGKGEKGPEWRDDLCENGGRLSRGLRSCSPSSTCCIRCGGNRRGVCIERRSLFGGEVSAMAATCCSVLPRLLPHRLLLPLALQLPTIHRTPGVQKKINKSHNLIGKKKVKSINESYHDSSVFELHFYSQSGDARNRERERGELWTLLFRERK